MSNTIDSEHHWSADDLRAGGYNYDRAARAWRRGASIAATRSAPLPAAPPSAPPTDDLIDLINSEAGVATRDFAPPKHAPRASVDDAGAELAAIVNDEAAKEPIRTSEVEW